MNREGQEASPMLGVQRIQGADLLALGIVPVITVIDSLYLTAPPPVLPAPNPNQLPFPECPHHTWA